MKTKVAIFFLCIGSFQLSAQVSFDPETDTIALSNQQGLWKFLVPDETLIASAQLVAPNLAEVFDIRVQDIHRKPYLFFRGKNREMPEFGYTLMVLLIETSKGVWMTGETYQACWGSTCSTCGFDEYWGCSCERYGGPFEETAKSYCNHMAAIGKGLGQVHIPK